MTTKMQQAFEKFYKKSISESNFLLIATVEMRDLFEAGWKAHKAEGDLK